MRFVLDPTRCKPTGNLAHRRLVDSAGGLAPCRGAGMARYIVESWDGRRWHVWRKVPTLLAAWVVVRALLGMGLGIALADIAVVPVVEG